MARIDPTNIQLLCSSPGLRKILWKLMCRGHIFKVIIIQVISIHHRKCLSFLQREFKVQLLTCPPFFFRFLCCSDIVFILIFINPIPMTYIYSNSYTSCKDTGIKCYWIFIKQLTIYTSNSARRILSYKLRFTFSSHFSLEY